MSKRELQVATGSNESQGLYAAAGIVCTYAAPYNGRAKVVERFFSAFAHAAPFASVGGSTSINVEAPQNEQ